jgi:SAM-dependent methyltransferase
VTGEYAADLTFVHDVGFTNYVRSAVPFLVAHLVRGGGGQETIIDLGCGTGVWCAELLTHGFDVVGIDLSPDMIELAKTRAPQARFICGSLHTCDLPPCDGVTAIGEVLNYLHDERAGVEGAMRSLFERIASAITPGGNFIFDLALHGRCPEGSSAKHWVEDDWAMCQRAEERYGVLTRRLTVFRKTKTALWRRSDEVHRLRLYAVDDVVAMLEAAGFAVRVYEDWSEGALGGGEASGGLMAMPPGMSVFVATRRDD